MDVTNELRLGGFFEPGLHLNGPTPRNLVLPNAGQPIPPPLPVQAGGSLLFLEIPAHPKMLRTLSTGCLTWVGIWWA